jgi:hypothetical protein
MQNNLGKVKKVYLLKPFKTRFYKKLGIKKVNFSKLSIYVFLSLILVMGVREVLNTNVNHSMAYSMAGEQNYYRTSLDIDPNAIVFNNQTQNVLGINNAGNTISTSINVVDQRVYVFDQYFLANNSPLYGYGKYFVEKCDQYGAPKDCITVIAIARNESNLCKYKVSAEMFNCWGFGGGGEYRMTFNNFEESIDRVTRVLVQEYGRAYIENPSLMEGTFCGPQDECKNWGNSIKFFIRQIDEFGRNLGVGSLLELRNS